MIRATVALTVMLTLVAAVAWAAPVLRHEGTDTVTQVVLYTGAPNALVRQSSMVRLHEGANSLTFEWPTDKIDAAGVRLQAPAGVAVGEMIRPAGADKALQWTLTSQADGIVPVTMVYELGGVKWAPRYRLTWTPGADAAVLRGYVTVTNESGVELAGVRAQLVLGRPGAAVPEQGGQPTFPITGLDALSPGASVRASLLPPMTLGARLIHRIDSERAPEQVRRWRGIQPPTSGGLGREVRPPGPMTVIVDDGGEFEEMIAAELRYEPGEEFEVDLGVARDILVRRRLLERSKLRLEFDRLGRVSGFDTIERYELQVRNLSAADADLEIVETVLAPRDFETDALHVVEAGRVVMHLRVPTGGDGLLQFTLTKHSGTRIP